MAMTPEEIIEAKSRLFGGLNYVLEPGEQVLVIVVGALRQAVVGTDRRLFVYKAGNQAGVMFGRRAKSWDYADVANLRLDIGVKGGVLTVVPVVPDKEILAYGASGHGTPQQSPNAITFASKPGTAVAARVHALLEMVAEAHRARTRRCLPLRNRRHRPQVPQDPIPSRRSASWASSGTPASSRRRNSRRRRPSSSTGSDDRFSRSPVPPERMAVRPPGGRGPASRRGPRRCSTR